MTPSLGPSSPLHALAKPKRAHTHKEAPVQSAVVRLYESCGCSVWSNTVYGAKPKGVRPGIPDLRVKHPEWRLDFDHECKPQGRRQSKEQHEYMTECQQMGTVYVLGGVSEAIDFLDYAGIVGTRLADTARFKPRHEWAGAVALWSMLDLAECWYDSPAFARQMVAYGYKPPRK